MSSISNLIIPERHSRLHNLPFGMSHEGASYRRGRSKFSCREISLAFPYKGKFHYLPGVEILHLHLVQHLHLFGANL